MSKYTDFIEAFKASNGGNGAKVYSKNDLASLATVMFNDPETSFQVVVKKGDTFQHKEINPAKDLRTALIQPILKQYGVDRAEMDKVMSVETTRSGGEALADFSLMLIKNYISKNGMGRKLTLPMTSTDETVQSIVVDEVPEEVRTTTMIVKDGDAYKTVPTGNQVTTKAHTKLKVGNRVPAWLKDTKALQK